MLEKLFSRRVIQFRHFISYSKAQCLPSISTGVELKRNHLKLTDNGSLEKDSVLVDYEWLRDHCRCSRCYDSATNQRRLEISQLQSNVRPEVAKAVDNDKLEVWWSPEHPTSYSLDWLKRVWTPRHNGDDKTRPIREFWDGPRLRDRGGIPEIPYQTVMETENGIKTLFKHILVDGIAAVVETPFETIEETKKLAKRVSIIEETVYDKFWVVDPTDSDRKTHQDTAYGTQGIGLHTDGTYYRNTPGLQLFHILRVATDGGGMNVFLDGFNALNQLEQRDPKAFHFLSTCPIPHHYLESGSHLRSEEPVIFVHPLTGALVQIRYNPYDRAPLEGLSREQVREFYRSYRALSARIGDPINEFWIRLSPGTVVFVDNWRVLHGRTTFKGSRTLSGCYISRDDFLSRARTLGFL